MAWLKNEHIFRSLFKQPGIIDELRSLWNKDVDTDAGEHLLELYDAKDFLDHFRCNPTDFLKLLDLLIENKICPVSSSIPTLIQVKMELKKEMENTHYSQVLESEMRSPVINNTIQHYGSGTQIYQNFGKKMAREFFVYPQDYRKLHPLNYEKTNGWKEFGGSLPQHTGAPGFTMNELDQFGFNNSNPVETVLKAWLSQNTATADALYRVLSNLGRHDIRDHVFASSLR
jgi:hypothetical protein